MDKIFILEDDGERLRVFGKAFEHDNVIITNNATTGIGLLNDFKYDIILLDHDLGGVAYVDTKNHNTGSWLCENMNNVNKNTLIIIHSWNQVGAKNMEIILRHKKHFNNVHVVPFTGSVDQYKKGKD